jgi:hypothetical protein
MTVLILVITAFAAGCPSPMGSIGSPPRSVNEGLMIVSPLVFKAGYTFTGNEIKVYTLTKTGDRSQNPVTPSGIRVIEKRGGSPEAARVPPYTFPNAEAIGIYSIEVKYEEITARYPIDVKMDDGTGDDQDSTIIIIWESDQR